MFTYETETFSWTAIIAHWASLATVVKKSNLLTTQEVSSSSCEDTARSPCPPDFIVIGIQTVKQSFDVDVTECGAVCLFDGGFNGRVTIIMMVVI